MTADKADDVRILQLSDLAVNFPVALLQLGNFAAVFVPLFLQLGNLCVQVNSSLSVSRQTAKAIKMRLPVA